MSTPRSLDYTYDALMVNRFPWFSVFVLKLNRTLPFWRVSVFQLIFEGYSLVRGKPFLAEPTCRAFIFHFFSSKLIFAPGLVRCFACRLSQLYNVYFPRRYFVSSLCDTHSVGYYPVAVTFEQTPVASVLLAYEQLKGRSSRCL